MIEAVRIASAEGVEFDPDTFTMISTFKVPSALNILMQYISPSSPLPKFLIKYF
jgi:hypothetical protein